MSGNSWASIAATGIQTKPVKQQVVHPSTARPVPANADNVKAFSSHANPDAERMAHRGKVQRDPLVLSLRLNRRVLDELTTIRQQNFPPEHNNLEAHLTILHALPAEAREDMQLYLQKMSQTQSAIKLSLGKVQVKTRIVLLPVRAHDLNDAVHRIQKQFWNMLSDQDRSPFRQGHITLCNKRSEEEIAERGAEIESRLSECDKWHCTGLGLDLWIYQGNRPWKHISYHPFQGQHGG